MPEVGIVADTLLQATINHTEVRGHTLHQIIFYHSCFRGLRA